MNIRKPNICPHQLDVQEANVVSHISTESEIISWEAGFRLDGVPALDLWDLIVAVSWKHESEPYRTGRLVKEQT